MNSKVAYKLASQLDGVKIKDHFGSDSFSSSVRMFLTIWHDKNQANIRFDLDDQKRFLSLDGEAFSEIENSWGKQGWTTLHFDFIEKSVFQEALKSAWKTSQEKKSSAKKRGIKK